MIEYLLKETKTSDRFLITFRNFSNIPELNISENEIKSIEKPSLNVFKPIFNPLRISLKSSKYLLKHIEHQCEKQEKHLEMMRWGVENTDKFDMYFEVHYQNGEFKYNCCLKSARILSVYQAAILKSERLELTLQFDNAVFDREEYSRIIEEGSGSFINRFKWLRNFF